MPQRSRTGLTADRRPAWSSHRRFTGRSASRAWTMTKARRQLVLDGRESNGKARRPEGTASRTGHRGRARCRGGAGGRHVRGLRRNGPRGSRTGQGPGGWPGRPAPRHGAQRTSSRPAAGRFIVLVGETRRSHPRYLQDSDLRGHFKHSADLPVEPASSSASPLSPSRECPPPASPPTRQRTALDDHEAIACPSSRTRSRSRRFPGQGQTRALEVRHPEWVPVRIRFPATSPELALACGFAMALLSRA